MDVTGISVAKAQEIEDASIVSGHIASNGHLILTTGDSTEIDAGLVKSDTTLVSGVDANTLTESGFYQVGATSTNLPGGATSGYLTVTGTGTYGAQVFQVNAGDHFWHRSRAGGAWSTWRELAPYKPMTKVEYLSSGTFTKASYPGATRVKFDIWGGGGSGAGGIVATGGGGGGGGGHFDIEFPIADIPTSLNVTVGAGGATTSAQNGNPGGTSQVGDFGTTDDAFWSIGAGGGGRGSRDTTTDSVRGGGGGGTAGGGVGSQGGDAGPVASGSGTGIQPYRGADGTGVSGDAMNSSLHGGGSGGAFAIFFASGQTIWGGGGGANGNVVSGGQPLDGGHSYRGGNGGGSDYNVNGGNGAVPGGGGGGGGKKASGTSNGGAGGNGKVIAWVYYD